MSVISLESFKQLDDATSSALLKCIEEWPWEFLDTDIDHQTATMYLSYKSDISSKDIRITKQAEYRRRLFDLELYKDFRQNERARSTSVNHWPANLSKKEVALCKIQMITSLFNICVDCESALV
jgi:predicted transport protein